MMARFLRCTGLLAGFLAGFLAHFLADFLADFLAHFLAGLLADFLRGLLDGENQPLWAIAAYDSSTKYRLSPQNSEIEKEERACKVREATLVERQQLLCHLPVDYPHKILH